VEEGVDYPKEFNKPPLPQKENNGAEGSLEHALEV
jgi:hypothetical protein